MRSEAGRTYEAGLGGCGELLFSSLAGRSIYEELAVMLSTPRRCPAGEN